MKDPKSNRSRPVLTAFMWTAACLTLLLGGLVAAEFVLMATSLDPGEMIAAGIEPWREGIVAVVAVVGLFLATVLSLRLWHTVRFRWIGLAIMFAQIASVVWVCARVLDDYF